MADFPVLKTARFTLRELTKHDAPALLAIHGDADTIKRFGTDPITRIDQSKHVVELFAGWRTAPSPPICWGLRTAKLISSVPVVSSNETAHGKAAPLGSS